MGWVVGKLDWVWLALVWFDLAWFGLVWFGMGHVRLYLEFYGPGVGGVGGGKTWK